MTTNTTKKFEACQYLLIVFENARYNAFRKSSIDEHQRNRHHRLVVSYTKIAGRLDELLREQLVKSKIQGMVANV